MPDLQATARRDTLGQINYSVGGSNKISQGINPGVFFFYSKITTTTAEPGRDGVADEHEHEQRGAVHAQSDQIRLYKGDCSSFTGGTSLNGGAGASFTITTPGTYVISIKYSTKSIAGTTAPVPANITYNFTTSLAGGTGASVLLVKG